MRSSLQHILPFAIGPMPDLCMGVLAIVMGDTTIPVEERRAFLEVVFQSSPSDEHRAELESLVIRAFDSGHFLDLISTNSVQNDLDNSTIVQ